MTKPWEEELARARAKFWRGLSAVGFTGHGDTLHGPLPWHRHDGTAATAKIEVNLTNDYPFGPPRVRIIDAGAPLTAPFHRGLDGVLCLWPADTPVDKAPWREPAVLLHKTEGWLQQTDAGWPDDTACDLERYLPADPRLMLYDLATLPAAGCVRTETTADGQRITVTDQQQRPPDLPKHGGRQRGPTRGRKHRRLVWLADFGDVARPIEDWTTLAALLGDNAGRVGRLIRAGAVEFLMLRYRRNRVEGVLALSVRPSPTRGGPIEVRSCEAADTSVATRMMRAGSAAAELAGRRVAVVGAGAVGSFVADLLFRHGVRYLTLLDGQLLRPGNLVRHLAGEPWVGYSKTVAVSSRLASLGFDATHVETRHEKLTTPEQAIRLVREHDLVIDASADPRASAVLGWAAGTVGRPMVSVCVERQGGIIRVDRFPLRRGERHHPPVTARGGDLGIEHGCDDPVSLTPPTSVVAAAQLACRAAIDELTRTCALPATLLEILEPQEPPYDRLGFRSEPDLARRRAA